MPKNDRQTLESLKFSLEVRATININKLAYPDAEPHTIFGAVTRIWTLNVKRSQLTKVTK